MTDPPYGIGADKLASKNNGKWGWTYYGETDWDADRPSKEVFELILSAAKTKVIWGGNYFTDFLPPSMQWLIWDKGQRNFSLADFEMAWSSQWKAGRAFTFSRSKALLDGKEHPTQKPVEVMAWCLDQLPATATTILDPFMGSGTTGVASVKRGKAFTGIEREPKYFDLACRRVAAALACPDLFIAKPDDAAQESLAL